MTWSPATKAEVEQAVLLERINLEPEALALIDRYAVDPYAVAIERFGGAEQAFVVARSGTHVIYYEDVEESFGTAREVDHRLVERADYGSLLLAVRVLHEELTDTQERA